MAKPQLKSVLSTPAPRTRGEAEFVPARLVWERYCISEMTLWRWLKDKAMGFPQPVYFGRFRYWRLRDLEAWERKRAAARA